MIGFEEKQRLLPAVTDNHRGDGEEAQGEEEAAKEAPSSWLRRVWRRGSAAAVVIAFCCLLLVQILGMTWRLSIAHGSVVESVLRSVPLIDGHDDFPFFLRLFYRNRIYNITEESELPGQVDFPRLQKGHVGGQFWSVFTTCPLDNGNYSDAVYADSVHDTLQQIDLVHRLAEAFPHNLVLTTTAEAVMQNFQSSRGKRISSLMGVEGLHQIGNSASILRMYHRLGVRYVTLTHNCHNKYADAAISPISPVHGGLSTAGRVLVKEMNRMGMIVDLSHTSADTMRDALNVTEAPVMFSHSGARAVCAHPRNVPDDVLHLVKANRGVVMVTFLPEFTSDEPEKASLVGVADHIQYIGELIGYEHVGIGSDFDGMPRPVKGLEDVSKYPDLLSELVKRGVGRKQLKGVVGGNVLRVLEEVEGVAKKSTRDPLEDDVKAILV